MPLYLFSSVVRSVFYVAIPVFIVGCAGSPIATKNQTPREIADELLSGFETERLCSGVVRVLTGECKRSKEASHPGYCEKMMEAANLVLLERGTPDVCREKIANSMGLPYEFAGTTQEKERLNIAEKREADSDANEKEIRLLEQRKLDELKRADDKRAEDKRAEDKKVEAIKRNEAAKLDQQRIDGQASTAELVKPVNIVKVSKSELEQIKKAVVRSFFDPEAARFGQVTVLSNELACVSVNGKNRFGGYVGESPTVASKIEGQWVSIGGNETKRLSHEACVELIKNLLSE